MPILKNVLSIALLISLSVWLTSCGSSSSSGSSGGDDDPIMTAPGSSGGDDDPIMTAPGRPDIKFEVVEFTLTKVLGEEQTILLSPGFGIPKGILFLRSGTFYGLESFEGNSNLSIGFTDGINQAVMNPQIDSEITPELKVRNVFNDSRIAFRSQSTSELGIKEAHEIRPFDTADEFTIKMVNKHSTSTRAYEMVAVVIGGSDVESVAVDFKSLGNTTSPVVHTGVGSEADLIFGFTIGQGRLNGVAVADWYEDVLASYGVYINDGSDSQASTSWDSTQEGTSSANGSGMISNNRFLAKVDGEVLTYDVKIDNVGPDGFSTTTSSAAGNDLFASMVITFKNRPRMTLTDSSVATAGDFSTTAPGFNGDFFLWSNMMGMSSYNTRTTSSVSMGLTALDRNKAWTITNSFQGSGEVPTDLGAQASVGPGLWLVDSGAQTVNASSTSYAITSEGIDFAMASNPPSAITLGWMLALGLD